MDQLQSLVESSGGRKTFHTVEPLRRTTPYRVFTVVYVCAVAALFYRHIQTLIFHSKTLLSLSISISLLFSDIILAFMWATAQSCRLKPVRRKEFPQELRRVLKEESFPAIDVFICTADPYKEPPGSVVNTALSLMAYEYPAEKLSVYVSDDGGSALTLFAFMEAAKFARHWLPFCRENKVMERSPDEFFSSSDHASFASSQASKIKMMYEELKDKIEGVMEKGKVGEEDFMTNCSSSPDQSEAFRIWDSNFTRQDHPAVIQILLNKSDDKDISGHAMPNLIYVSREKRKGSPHHFKAGALNVLVRVSGVLSNAPIILTQDCDMYSNDPETPLRVLCYLSDPSLLQSKLGYIQFPQRFHGINKDDIYANEYKHLFIINPMGMDGFMGPSYVGSGCFFLRRALFGGPSSMVHPQLPQLRPDHVVSKPIHSEPILALAHQVAASNYENMNTGWGSKMGMRYGSLVEDFYTGYRLQCEGWKALFCNPDRAAFWGDIPITLLDNLNQCKRWCIGLLQVTFSSYNPLTYGAKSTHILSALAFAHNSHWPFWSIPIATYAFLPQLALLNAISIFPRLSDKWFILYIFLFLGAYIQHLLDFLLNGGTLQRWWSAQRMWLIRGLTSFLFGTAEYLLKSLGISTQGFSLTSKVLDDEQSKRYEQGVFEFGVVSPMFVPLTMAALINLLSVIWGAGRAIGGQNMEGLWLQMLLAGFVAVNSIPIYEAIAVRSDAGKMPNKTVVTAMFFAGLLCAGSSMIF